MKLTVLIENTAPAGCGLCAEHGLSLYIEYRGKNILLDAGSSGSAIDNAKALGIDLSTVQFGVLSHGHYDHADGFRRFFQENTTAKVYLKQGAERAYFSVSTGESRFVGIHRELWQQERERFEQVTGKYQLSDGVWLIPQGHIDPQFASRETALLEKMAQDTFIPDTFHHEHSLVLEGERGLVVCNSCSHNGIVNIVRTAKEQLQKPIYAVIGGLHLFSRTSESGMNCSEEYVKTIADALIQEGVEQVYTGHCTGDQAFALLKTCLGERLHPLFSGQVISIP